MAKTVVVKLGGSTLGGQSGVASPDTVLNDLIRMTAEGTRLILVHGGGNATSDLLRKMGEEPRFLNGLRVTDATALQATTMMIRGQINTDLVQSFNKATKASGLRHPVYALGMSGIDGRMLEARRERGKGDLGFVGEVVGVNLEPLIMALEAGFVPIVAPLGISVEDDAAIFNLNADTAAAAIAATIEADATVFLTDVPGVLSNEKKTYLRLGVKSSHNLINTGIITGGMIPKIEAALKALEGSKRVMILDGRQPDALYNAVEKYLPNGTTFVRRKLMQVDISEIKPVNPQLPYTLITAPTDIDLIAPALHRGYYGTIDFDWQTESQAREITEQELNPDWGDYQAEFSIAALDGEKLVGMCQVSQLHEAPHQMCISNVFVLPEYRGQGLARAFIQTSLNRMFAAGHTQIVLRVTVGNDAAYRLYQNLGFYDLETYDV